MSWLESHQELRDHPKTARLRRRLGVSLPQAIGHLHLLWWWALDYAPTGHLAVYDADVIADAACWEDDPGVFVRALIGAGFVNDDMTIHDWEDYAGRLIDKREANAKRKRADRSKQRAIMLGDSSDAGRPAGHLPDVAGTSGARPADTAGLSGLLATLVTPDSSGARPAGPMPDMTGTSPGRPADVQGLPDLTGPDLTGPDRTTPTPTPPPQAGEGMGARRRRRPVEIPDDVMVAPPAPLAPLDPATMQLWRAALDGIRSAGTLNAGNLEQVCLLEPLGRDDAGALHLRAPPGLGLERFTSKIALALADAGDQAANRVVIRES